MTFVYSIGLGVASEAAGPIQIRLGQSASIQVVDLDAQSHTIGQGPIPSGFYDLYKVESVNGIVPRGMHLVTSSESVNLVGIPAETGQYSLTVVIRIPTTHVIPTNLPPFWAFETEAVSSRFDLRVLRPLPGADLSGMDLGGKTLNGWNLTRANLTGANLTRAVLRGTNFRGAKLSGANLNKTILRGADFTGSQFMGSQLTNADISGANFRNSALAGIRTGGLRGSPLFLPNGWKLMKGYLVGPCANLSGADLQHQNFAGANLSGVNFSGSNLNGANLTGALLVDANLTQASVADAVWMGSMLNERTTCPNGLQFGQGGDCPSS